MRDYINYIDFNSIKLADLANELGDYRLAIQNYSNALSRLRNYNGDRMQPIMMAGDLVNKIEKLSKYKDKGTLILRFHTWTLTKSSYVKGSQCIKYLFLDKYKKKERKPISEEKRILFKKGHAFENTVREIEFPGGKNIKEIVRNFAYFNSYTKHLLLSQEEQILYEATIIEDSILVMCDVLIKNENELIDIYEIKLNSELNDAILNDLSVQYFVCQKRFGKKLNSFNVILRSDDDKEEKWLITNLKNDLEEKLDVVENNIKHFNDVLQKTEPSILMGDHCRKPYECEFIEYCSNK